MLETLQQHTSSSEVGTKLLGSFELVLVVAIEQLEDTQNLPKGDGYLWSCGKSAA